MASKKIYLVRHGQTDYNKSGIIQGSRIDASINELGRAQANAFFEAYKDIPFERVYTSALVRSIQSVQHFIDKGIPWTSYAELNEISWGVYDGKNVAEGDVYWDVINAWHNGDTDRRTEEGESPEDVKKRQQVAMTEIMREDADPILICMHGRAMRILLAHLTGKAIKDMDQFKHHNLGLYVLNYLDGQFEIEISNDLSHLEVHEGLIIK